MVKSLSFFIASRFRKGRRRGGMVSVVSMISTLSIALGVAVLIIGLSTMNGFEKELKDRILSVIPHGEIYKSNTSISDWREMEQVLRGMKNIAAVTPYVNFTGLVENKNKLKAIQIRGIDAQQEDKSFHFSNYLSGNDWKNFTPGQQQIILGQGVAAFLNVTIGDRVTIVVANNTSNSDYLKIQQPKRIRLQVAGILELSGDLGYQFALVPLQDAQKYLSMDDDVSGIMLTVNNVFNAYDTVYRAAVALEQPVEIRSWEFDYGYMYRDIQLIRSIMYLAMVLVIGVACFNIISTLVIAVKDKSSDIAILKTLGADDKLMRAIFTWYGLLAGCIGCFFGVILGVFTSLNLSRIIKIIESVTGHQFLAGNIYFIDFIPSQLYFKDVIIVLITALILTLLASWFSSRRACKVDPVKVLNGN